MLTNWDSITNKHMEVITMTKEQQQELYEELYQDPYKREKYNKPGIYCIAINKKVVYIGKSTNMLNRLAAHILEIQSGFWSKSNKYRVLYEAYAREDCQIDFRCLYEATSKEEDEVLNEIGIAEAIYINEIKPALNYQIPSMDNYKHYTVNRKAKYITLAEILEPEKPTFYF